MTISLNAEVRARLDAHLDAVERALVSGGSSREHRRGVADDLEAQILDMLGGKSATPTVVDLEAVLEGLDPPSAYGDAGRAVPQAAAPQVVPAARVSVVAQPRYSRTAIWGLVLILVSFVPLPLVFVLLMFIQVPAQRMASITAAQPSGSFVSPPGSFSSVEAGASTAPIVMTATAPASVMTTQHTGIGLVGLKGLCVLVPIFPLAMAGTILGWIAFGQIRASRGKLYGKGMALFDGLFYPGMIALYVVVGLIHDLL